mgnify:CR=1 FL=1
MKEVSITARRELIATLADLTKTLKHDFRLEDDDERTNENIRPEYSCDNVQFINRDVTRDNVSTVMVDFINNLPQNKEVVEAILNDEPIPLQFKQYNVDHETEGEV